MKLAKLDPKLVEAKHDRVHKFEMGLRTEIRKQIVPYEPIIFATVVNKALLIEREVNKERAKRERNQKKRSKSSESQGQNSKTLEVQTRDQQVKTLSK